MCLPACLFRFMGRQCYSPPPSMLTSVYYTHGSSGYGHNDTIVTLFRTTQPYLPHELWGQLTCFWMWMDTWSWWSTLFRPLHTPLGRSSCWASVCTQDPSTWSTSCLTIMCFTCWSLCTVRREPTTWWGRWRARAAQVRPPPTARHLHIWFDLGFLVGHWRLSSSDTFSRERGGIHAHRDHPRLPVSRILLPRSIRPFCGRLLGQLPDRSRVPRVHRGGLHHRWLPQRCPK